MLSKHVKAEDVDPGERDVAPMFGSRVMAQPIPRYRMPDEETPSRAVYQLIRDEMSLDGTPLLNLASFVTTWMEPEADLLAAEVAGKNFIDQEEYPIPSVLERRCVSIIADLFHAPSTGEQAVGTSTIGSSEAIHLCGLALKRNWQARRTAAGRDVARPNLVMSSAVHVTWEKFCRYFEVEPREVPLQAGRWTLDPAAALARCDENTIGVVGILGSTYTGHFDPVAELDAAVTAWNAEHDGTLGIHVDAASGGFVAPFAYPDLAWDFRLPNVRSINVSGHKYGLVYPGVGWAIWRDADDLPEDLIFHDSYLGNDQSTFDLNFSKPTAGVVGQYYNLIRLGRVGYTSIMRNALDTCQFLADEITARGRAEVVSEPGNLPVLCVRLEDESRFNAHDVANALRRKGWIVPAYTMPADLQEMSVLRVVVREGFSRDLAVALLDDLHAMAEELHLNPPPAPAPHRHGKQRVC